MIPSPSPASAPAPSHSHSHSHQHSPAPGSTASASQASGARSSLPRSPAGKFLSSTAANRDPFSDQQPQSQRSLTSSPAKLADASGSGSNTSLGAGSGSGYFSGGQGPGSISGNASGSGDINVNAPVSPNGSGQGLGDYMARSSSAISNLSSSSASIPPHPGLLRRRSTDTSTSGGLDYYWSSLAGAGASSSSSSLGVSPSPSTGLAMSASGVSPSPVSSMKALKEARYLQSRNNQGIAEEEDLLVPSPELATRSTSIPSQQVTPRQPELDGSDDNVKKLQALNINYPSSRTKSNNNNNRPSDPSNIGIEKGGLSPGGWSESSRYSTNDSVPPSAGGLSSRQSPAISRHNPQSRPYLEPNSQYSDSESSGSAYSPAEYKLQVGSFDFENPNPDSAIKRGTTDPLSLPLKSFGEHGGDGSTSSQSADQLVWDVRSSMNSTSTFKQDRPESRGEKERDEEFHRTPMAPVNDNRPEIRPPTLAFHDQQQRGQHDPRYSRSSPTGSGSGGHLTPKRSPVSRSNASSSSHYTPTTPAQLGLGFDGINAGSGSVSPARSSSSHRSHTEPAPRSAPADQGDFGDITFTRNTEGSGADDEGEDDDTLKRRGKKKRTTLPATTSTSSGAIVESILSPSKEDLLSPDKYARAITPTRENGERRGSTPSPNRSPEPPPKSRLRTNSSSRDTPEPPAVAENTSSLNRTPQSLPMIINTSSSPLPSPDRPKAQTGSLDKPQPRRPDRSPDRQHSPVFPSSATINDLTDMLGGAIDAIGLIDSRETPPPTVSEPSKKPRPSMTLALAPAAEVTDRGPMTPTSLPTRGASLPGPSISSASLATNATLSHPIPQDQGQSHVYARRSTQPELKHKASSLFSFGSGSGQQQQSPTMAISVRPWPAAMLYGNIKGMKHAGDRAKGYARAINELARSESGLREWCIAVSTQSHRPTVASINNNNNKMSIVSSLGVRSNSVPSAIPLPYQLSPYDPTPHQRNVSAGSEFPMRADSYAAREISQRVLDPADQPTALPSNLPYPQLQNQAQHLGHGGISGGPGMGGGLKPSQSMQSVASFSSSKKGFFSAIGRKGTSKKESLSLGPPGAYMGGGAGGSTAKKDVRGLPISGPRSASPQKDATTPTTASSAGGGMSGGASHALPRAHGSISAPMGPRGPRMGSFTPPPQGSGSLDRGSMEITTTPGRASLDTGLSRMTPPHRESLDAHRTPRGNGSISGSVPMPLRGVNHSDSNSNSATTLGGGAGGAALIPWDDEVRSMADILPHVEKSTLRVYLGRYGGDQMQAIGGYLEDEKNGTVLR